MKPRKCYELRINGTLAARGKIDMIADALGMSVSTVQRLPYKGHSIKGIELEPLPNLYDFMGGAYTLEEISKMTGAPKHNVVVAAGRCQGVKGHRVVKHRYDEFSISREEVERLRDEVDDR